MIRDYLNHELQRILGQLEDLGNQEQIVRNARGPENRRRREVAEGQAKRTRENILTNIPPAVTYELLDATGTANAVDFRSVWQEKNRRVNCLQELTRHWKEGSAYYREIFETPRVDLAILPAYSFIIQFTFTLSQSYISRDEQNFYIIDNPVRKDKIFGLPYVASTSWKGSLRAALWQLGHKKEDILIHRNLLGNEQGTEAAEDFRAGRLYFYPTFFIMKGLEIINPQDRVTRAGSLPILFESVPEGTTGVFTLLYVPFDLIGQDEQLIRKKVAEDLPLLTTGLQSMFCTYGFGAKTSSGFGLAREDAKGTLSIHADYPSESFESFARLKEIVEKHVQNLKEGLEEA